MTVASTGVDGAWVGPTPVALQLTPALVRLVGFSVVVAVAVALAYVLLANADSSDPIYEDEEDDDPGLYKPGPAYGATGTLDVEEVLQVDGEGESSGGGDESGDTESGESPAEDDDGLTYGSPDFGEGTTDTGDSVADETETE